MPLIPAARQSEFAYEMAKTTTRLITDPTQDVERSKAQYAYEMAQLTTRIISLTYDAAPPTAVPASPKTTTVGKAQQSSSPVYTAPPVAAAPTRTAPPTANPPGVTFSDPQLRNNNEIVHSSQPQAVKAPTPAVVASRPPADPGYISPATYRELVNEVTHVGKDHSGLNKTINFDGEIRYHYALNSGSSPFDRDSSGLRIRVAADKALVKDWRLFAMAEMQHEFFNYGNDIRLSRLYASGKLGTGRATVGRFGYLMAEGNIYDSGFTGVRYDVGTPVNYTLAVGATDESDKTTVATARYRDFDYDLEAGVYNDRSKGGERKTIWNLGGNYHLNNFTLGAMVLSSSEKDSKGNRSGYVFSLYHGDLKTWRPGTYTTFVKYYDQPRGTYIAHGMNGLAGKMQGFKGFGAGVRYTFAENFVGALEYYKLKDKVTDMPGDTWWLSMSYYF